MSSPQWATAQVTKRTPKPLDLPLPQDWLTTKEVAALWDCTEWTARYRLKRLPNVESQVRGGAHFWRAVPTPGLLRELLSEIKSLTGRTLRHQVGYIQVSPEDLLTLMRVCFWQALTMKTEEDWPWWGGSRK